MVSSSTGYCYAPVLLTGGVAFLGEEVTNLTDCCGGVELHRYTFQFLKTGQAQIQFAKFRPFDLSDALYEDVLQFTVEPGEIDGIHGGWSVFDDLDDNDKKILDEALGGFLGVKYEALKVSRQIINGTNYRFFCTGTIASKGNETFPAIVKVYKPIYGDAVVTGIERVVL